MREITLDQKLQRKKKTAITSVIIFLVLFVGVLIFQLSWNLFRFRFAKDGLAVLVDSQLAVGVEKIYRGEEATQILQKLSKNNPTPDEGKEFVLLKIKVKNISWWKANPRYLEFRLNTQSTDEFGDWTSNVGFYNPPTGEFKILDTSKYFKPGEVRDGIFCYEVENGKTLSEINIERSNLKSFIFRGNKRFQISFFNYQSVKTIILLLYLFLFYLLFIFSLQKMVKQRETREDGIVWSIVFSNISLLIYPIIFFNSWIVTSYSRFFKVILIFLLIYLFLFLVTLLLSKNKNLIQFCFLKKEDLECLIDEFAKRMNFGVPIINRVTSTQKHFFYESVDSVEVKNPSKNETYFFVNNVVQVRHATQESKKAKEVLLDLFYKTNTDLYSYYSIMLSFHLAGIFLILLFYFSIH